MRWRHGWWAGAAAILLAPGCSDAGTSADVPADVPDDTRLDADATPDETAPDGEADGEEAAPDVEDVLPEAETEAAVDAEDGDGSGDRDPPEFDGLTAAFPCDGRVVLEWRPAVDDSPPVTYRVFRSAAAGDFDWSAPLLETEALSATVEGLANGTPVYFAVRAVDAAGNEDDNEVEREVTPLVAYPTLPVYERIYEPDPVLLPSCHSSCIVELPGGELLTSWYCGEGEHTPDVAIWGSRHAVGASAWTAPAVLMDTPGLPDGNDVLYVGTDGRVWLFWALQVESAWDSAVVQVSISEDLGRTFGTPFPLGTPGGYLPRTHPKTLDNGWIILPLYVEYTASAVVVHSEDGGATWSAAASILPFLGTQPTVIQRADGSLFAMMRSGAPPQRSWQARSTDRGLTWGDRALSGLNNPGSSLEMATLQSGRVAVAFNDSTEDRTNLTLALSSDEGASWPVRRRVEDDPPNGYDYPSIIQDRCGLIHVTYSWRGRSSIAHFVADEEWIEGP